MTTFMTVLHIVASLFLVLVVLLQHGKGADIGAAFGGGSSQTVFGGRGAGNFLTKLTTAFVAIFMLTSIVLSYFSGPRTVSQIIETLPQPEIPAEPQAPIPSTLPGAEPIAEPSAGAESDVPAGFEAIPAPSPESSGTLPPDGA